MIIRKDLNPFPGETLLLVERWISLRTAYILVAVPTRAEDEGVGGLSRPDDFLVIMRT